MFTLWNSNLERFSESQKSVFSRILLQHGKGYKNETHRCIVQSISWLCRIFASPDPLSSLPTLLWGLGKLATVTAPCKSRTSGFCSHLDNEKPCQGTESGRRESVRYWWPQLPLHKMASCQWLNGHNLCPADLCQRHSPPGSWYCPSFCLFRLTESKSNLAIAVLSLVGFLNLAPGM